MNEKHEKIKTVVLSGAIGGFQDSQPENTGQTAEMLSLVYETIQKAAVYHGGEMFHYLGREFLILFKDNSRKPPALKALDAARELMKSLREISLSFISEGVKAKAGLDYGELITGYVGKDEYRKSTHMGLPLEIAQRVRLMANWDQLLVSQSIADQCAGSYDFEALEPVPVKELAEPLRIFKCTGKRERAPDASSISGRLIQSPMVGREKELEILKTALLELYRGKGQIINISGAPGTGKSRLLAELKKENILDKLYWFEGRGLSNGQHLSYHPFIGIIKSWTGIREEDSALVSEKKLREKILRIYPENPDEVLPFIARFMGLELSGADAVRISEIDPNALEKLMLRAIRELLVKLSALKPVVIAIEDLHWADQSFLTLLRSIYELSHSHPIVFINVFRPGYEETTSSLVRFLFENHASALTSIETTTLDRDSARELISNLLLSGQIPETFAGNIVSRTGGNPFFIEEVLRSLIDRGIISFSSNAFQISDEAGTYDIPENIQEVLHARVDNLDEKTRNLLDTASVIGRNFYFKVLDEAADTIGEVSERLQYLKNMQFIQETGDEGNLEFVFKHALAHQAAYDAMVEQKRKALHLKIAESIEKVFPERINEFYGTLAMHYSRAGNLNKAEDFMIKAGDESMKSAAWTEAADFYQDAFNAYLKNSGDEPDPVKVTRFYGKLGNAYQLGGKNREAINYYEKVLKHYGIAPPKGKLEQTFSKISNLLSILLYVRMPGIRFKLEANELDKWLLQILYFNGKALYSYDSKRWFGQTLHTFRYYSRFRFSSNAYGQATLAAYSIFFNWTGISLGVAQKLLDLSKSNLEQTTPFVQMEHHTYSKMHQFLEGNWKPDPGIEKIYESAQKRGDIFNLTVYLLFCSFISIELGNEKETFANLRKLRTLGEDFESHHTLAQYHRLHAVALLKFRKFGEFESQTAEGVAFTKETGHLGMLQIIYSMRTIHAALNDDLETAKSVLKEVEKLKEPLKKIKIWYSTWFLAKAYVLVEELKRNPEDSELRRQLLKTCQRAIKHSKMVPNNLIESQRIIGNVLWMTGHKKSAIAHYLKSISEAERVNGRLELSRTFFELGKRISGNGGTMKVNGLSGREYLDTARTMFLEMNLVFDLQELERLNNRK
jgi:class 3 adenylate cyclase/tetratricopeptide (TPR) repeat protein